MAPRTALILTVCAALLPVAHAVAGSLIPDPNDWYVEQGLSYFKPTFLRYSQTVELYSPLEGTYWGVRTDPVNEHYSVQHTDTRDRTTKYEILDAGTYSNVPRNTRPRQPDLYDTGQQHFFMRYNTNLTRILTLTLNFESWPLSLALALNL